MNNLVVEDLMEVQSDLGRSLSFTITGDPPTQERHRLAFMRAPPMGRMGYHIYDPSSRRKRIYATMVRNAMVNYGLTVPYFASNEPITLGAIFVIPRRRQDLVQQGGSTVLTQSAHAFPRKKDIDNLLKFVMDALQGVFYYNDVTITRVVVTKMFAVNPNARGWTELQFSSSSAPHPLATGVWA